MAVLQKIFSDATVLVAAVAAGVAIVTLLLGLYKQKRDNKIQRAKFGYELIDAIFKHETILAFLDSLDSKSTSVETLKNVLKNIHTDLPSDELAMRDGVDWLLLHFDRVEHAIAADLTKFEIIAAPIGYYVGLLIRIKPIIIVYIDRTGYQRVHRFLNRFKRWREAS